jgi:RimJ/RimL family protein N-acetyltransferase
MRFDRQPTLLGKLVQVRPLRASDFDALCAVGSDPLIWEQHPEPNRHEPALIGAFFEAALESGGALLVHDVQSHQVIGTSRFDGYDEALSEIEIGWTFLARSHWGGRFNGELKRLMIDHALQFVDSVIFGVGPTNLRSQRSVLKIGGVRIPERDDPDWIMFRVGSTKLEGAPPHTALQRTELR